ncbi:ORF6N domain-containing protein [Hathewaya proteolytica DSM 3090]|uniref:ORF6N domain-containing protein n=1 Tax=Hathewaya proteolytica DSM 3090 TaxID=1121331 RepID=A0A1M6S3X3_9CLOT|nr:ORF6N domain-containing protein [Hathewaya proteolytica]SHK39386.1 ORF6N domain-containing protein [Hathewaya proteolytica DSM 3090]
MNELVSISSKKISIKEFREQRVVTFKDIDMVHERSEGTAKRNFNENKSHFIEGTDYYFVKPKDVEMYEIRTSEINNAGTYLITESGYLMLVKSLTDDLAWKVQRDLVNNYFRVKEVTTGLNNLSPQLQLLINMELKQKQLENSIQETQEEVQAIKDVITLNPNAAWRRESNRILNAVGNKTGDFKKPKETAYNALKERGKCRPSVLVANLKKRALANGIAPSKAEKLNILDVLENEPRLKEIYVNIVKEIAIKEGIRV